MAYDALAHTWLHRGFEGDSRRSLVLCLKVVSELLPEFDRVGVFAPGRPGLEPRCVVSDGRSAALEPACLGVGEGPVHDGLLSTTTITVPDLARDGRWPAYAARASDLGLRAQLVVPVHHPDLGTVAVLSLGSTTAGEVSGTAALLGLVCAAQLAARLDPAAIPRTGAPGCRAPRRRPRCPITGRARPSRCTADSRGRGLRR